MTEITGVNGTSLVDEFRNLKPRQLLGMAVALVVSLVLEAVGFGTMCIGFLVISVILYMLPHLLGVESVRIKAILGAVFIVVALVMGTFMYTGVNNETAGMIDQDSDKIMDVGYDESSGVLTATLVYPSGVVAEPYVIHGKIDGIAFGNMRATELSDRIPMVAVSTVGAGTVYSADIDLPMDSYNLVTVYWDDDTGMQFTVDTGVSGDDMVGICFTGAIYTVAYSAVIFYMILGFSALMRRSITKTRAKMEAQGRLYPQGYGRCKECDAIVLPGEITCRKCGTYIDVPDELRAVKKDYFVCTDCGSEVPSDAKACPKCGARFDQGSVETEVRHVDGSVDTSTEYFVCGDCGEKVPSNAKRCPKCGATFDEDE
ncbi:MAG: zinc ribbon domain-containing protein [Candidatus Methanomethylophilaceae archaeon]|nr:zinc ribbon domain-containing protein [Candidatus Methanomethylophilaceae archaeon]